MPYSGLTNAVLSGEVSDHEYEMVQKTVAVRDGDDAIEINETNSNYETSADEGDERIEISLDTTTKELAEEGDSGEQPDDDDVDAESGEEDLPDFGTNVDPKNMTEAGEMLAQAEEGQQEVLRKALEGGVTQEQLDAMEIEYEQDGKLSDASYAQLEKAGLSKAFINSFMHGQVAVGERFANAVLDYVGGRKNFDVLAGYMGANQSEMVDAFNSAMERHDVVTIKALLDNSKALMKATYGTRPTRNVTLAAKPKAPVTNQKETEGFTSRADMVKAMSDKRYQRDAVYRREVELKVVNSTF